MLVVYFLGFRIYNHILVHFLDLKLVSNIIPCQFPSSKDHKYFSQAKQQCLYPYHNFIPRKYFVAKKTIVHIGWEKGSRRDIASLFADKLIKLINSEYKVLFAWILLHFKTIKLAIAIKNTNFNTKIGKSKR